MCTLLKKQREIVSKTVNSETIAKEWLKTPFETEQGILVCDGFRVLSKNIEKEMLTGDYKYVGRFLEHDKNADKVSVELKRTDVIKAVKGTGTGIISLISTGSKFKIAIADEVLYETEYKGKKGYICINAKYFRDSLNFISTKTVEIPFGTPLSQIRLIAPEYNCMVLPIRLCSSKYKSFVEEIMAS